MNEARWISDADEATFATEVIERSFQVPVVVDFWAQWCGPCRTLGPALEKAIEARGGSVWLVKVDVDQAKNLAAEYRIQGVPAVKAFVNGKVEGEFSGALPPSGIDSFLDGIIPAEEDTALRQAAVLIDEGRPAEARARLAGPLQSAAHRDGAQVLLARCFLSEGDLKGAEEALGAIPEWSPDFDRAQWMLLKLTLLRSADGRDAASLTDQVEGAPEDVSLRWALAGRLLADGELAPALRQLMEVLKRDRAFEQDGARRAMLAIFEELGVDHELSREFRQEMMIYM